MSVIAELLVAIGFDVQGADAAAAEVDGVTKSTKKVKTEGGKSLQEFAADGDFSMKSVIKSFGGAKAGVALAAVGIAAAVVAAGVVIANFVIETTKGLAQISNMAMKFGQTTDEFQRLDAVAAKFGATGEIVGKSISIINTKLTEVAAGGGEDFALTLRQIGVETEELAGKSATEQLGVISDALNAVEDPAKRTVATLKLFGEEGAALAPLLAQGSTEIDKMAAGVENLMSPEDIKRAQKFQRAIGEAKHSLKSLAGSIAIQIAPAVQFLVDNFKEFIEENRVIIDVILDLINVALIPLGIMFKVQMGIMSAFLWPIRKIAEAIQYLSERFKGLFEDAKNAASKWEWVQWLANAWDNVTASINKVIQKIKDFLLQFRPIRELAQELGIISGSKNDTTGQARGASFLPSGEKAGKVGPGISAQLSDVEARGARLFDELGLGMDRFAAKVESKFGKVLGDGAPVRGRGGGGGKPKEEAKKRLITPLETLLTEILGEAFTLEGLKTREMDIKDSDLKPETVVTINNFTMTNTQNITGTTDPAMIANLSATAVKKEINNLLKEAGQSSAVNVAR